MRIPTICGLIDRRILVNFRVDPDCIAKILPNPFRPQLVDGYAVGGICLIRLKNVRPKFFPINWGISSENAAHRIAVKWDSDGKEKTGVFIPRRDTNSRLNSWAGGTIFPGQHHIAQFSIKETESKYDISMTSKDGKASVQVICTSTRGPFKTI